MRAKTVKFGVVLLKEWMPNPLTGQTVNQVAGEIELVTAKDYDFQPKGNETNWGCRVGADDYGVLILGCQIRGIYWGRELPLTDAKNNVMDLRNGGQVREA